MSDDSELTGNMVTYRISVDRQRFLLRHPEQSTMNDCLALIAELADLRERLEVLREVRDDITAWGDRAWNNSAAAQATRWSCRLDEVLAAAPAGESESAHQSADEAQPDSGSEALTDLIYYADSMVPVIQDFAQCPGKAEALSQRVKAAHGAFQQRTRVPDAVRAIPNELKCHMEACSRANKDEQAHAFATAIDVVQRAIRQRVEKEE